MSISRPTYGADSDEVAAGDRITLTGTRGDPLHIDGAPLGGAEEGFSQAATAEATHTMWLSPNGENARPYSFFGG